MDASRGTCALAPLSRLSLCNPCGSTLYCGTVQARREGFALQEEPLEWQLDSQPQALLRKHALLHPGGSSAISSSTIFFVFCFFPKLFHSLLGSSHSGFGTTGSGHCSELHLLHQPPRQVFRQAERRVWTLQLLSGELCFKNSPLQLHLVGAFEVKCQK